MPEQVDEYYPDLRDPDMETRARAGPLAVFARTRSRAGIARTRTATSRTTAKSTRCAATSTGCTRGSRCFESELFGDDIKKILPIINPNGSDSAMFDNCLELLVIGGRSLPHAMMMMIPEPWTATRSMSDEKKAFYEYHSCLMEPWDGPASIAFTDGTMIGAVLDRNGLRPSRYYVTKDDLVIMASEAGVLPMEPERIVHKGRLQPGRMFLVDTEQGRIVADEEIKKRDRVGEAVPRVAQRAPGRADELTEAPDTAASPTTRRCSSGSRRSATRSRTCACSWRRWRETASKPIGSMGTDTPLAVLSDQPQLALRLFQAAVRAGHQSADRLHPRGDRSPRPRRPSAPRATCSIRSRKAATSSS